MVSMKPTGPRGITCFAPVNVLWIVAGPARVWTAP